MDSTLVPAPQRGREWFIKPRYQGRAMRVFRDNASMGAGADLWVIIEQALRGSAWLVLMASLNAASSQSVNREVAWWLGYKTGDRLLVVLAESEFANVDITETDSTVALPPALQSAFTEEPRWVDLRWPHDADHVSQSNRRLHDGVADIATALRELVGEHIRTMRLAWTAVACS